MMMRKSAVRRAVAFMLSLLTVFTTVCVLPVNNTEVNADGDGVHIEYIGAGTTVKTTDETYETCETITVYFDSAAAVTQLIDGYNSGTITSCAYDSTTNALKVTMNGTYDPYISVDIEGIFSSVPGYTSTNGGYINSSVNKYVSVVYRTADTYCKNIGLYYRHTGCVTNYNGYGSSYANSSEYVTQTVTSGVNYYYTVPQDMFAGGNYLMTGVRVDPYEALTTVTGTKEFYICAMVFGIDESVCTGKAASITTNRREITIDGKSQNKTAVGDEGQYITYSSTPSAYSLPDSITVRLNEYSIGDSIINASHDITYEYDSDTDSLMCSVASSDPYVCFDLAGRFQALSANYGIGTYDLYFGPGYYDWVGIVYKFNDTPGNKLNYIGTYYGVNGAGYSGAESMTIICDSSKTSEFGSASKQFTSNNGVAVTSLRRLTAIRFDCGDMEGYTPSTSDKLYIYAFVFGTTEAACSAAAAEAAEEANNPTDENLKLATVQVTLKSDIEMDFTVDTSSLADYTDIRVCVKDSTNKVTECTEKENHNGDSVSYVYTGISPQRADEPLTIYVTAKNNGKKCRSTDAHMFSYSLKAYCEDRLAASTNSTEKTLLADLLNYCQAAWDYDHTGAYTSSGATINAQVTTGGTYASFATTTVYNASDCLGTHYVLDADDVPSGCTAAVSGTSGSAKWTAVGVSLTDVISIMFRCSSDPGDCTVNGTAGVMYNVDNDSTVKAYAITASSLATDIAVKGTNTNTITYNVESYFYDVLTYQDEALETPSQYTTNLVNLIQAIMRYGRSANAYGGETAVKTVTY